MSLFYAAAAIYLAIGLVLAARVRPRSGSGLWRQLRDGRTVLAAGLLWPERAATRLVTRWDDPTRD